MSPRQDLAVAELAKVSSALDALRYTGSGSFETLRAELGRRHMAALKELEAALLDEVAAASADEAPAAARATS